jgi:hypothetical protein
MFFVGGETDKERIPFPLGVANFSFTVKAIATLRLLV